MICDMNMITRVLNYYHIIHLYHYTTKICTNPNPNPSFPYAIDNCMPKSSTQNLRLTLHGPPIYCSTGHFWSTRYFKMRRLVCIKSLQKFRNFYIAHKSEVAVTSL